MKYLSGYPFVFVANITLESNSNGSIKAFIPTPSPSKPFHKYGKGPFCYFSIQSQWKNKMGVYAFYADEELFYIGKCENLNRIINCGIGRISSGKCYKGGENTNCKINTAVLQYTQEGKKITLYFYKTQERDDVKSKLVAKYNPPYNGAGRI